MPSAFKSVTCLLFIASSPYHLLSSLNGLSQLKLKPKHQSHRLQSLAFRFKIVLSTPIANKTTYELATANASWRFSVISDQSHEFTCVLSGQGTFMPRPMVSRSRRRCRCKIFDSRRRCVSLEPPIVANKTQRKQLLFSLNHPMPAWTNWTKQRKNCQKNSTLPGQAPTVRCPPWKFRWLRSNPSLQP